MSNGEFQFLLMPTAFYLPYRQQKLCDYVCDLLLEESNVQPVSSPVTPSDPSSLALLAANMIPFQPEPASPESASNTIRVEQMFNLPNVLTLGRILMIPVYVGFFSTPTASRSIAAAAVFGLAAFTDLLDGYIARQRAQVTRIGRLFDPIADKCLVIAGLVLLVQFQRVAAWLAIMLIVRELAMTGVRAAAASQGLVIAAGTLGKYWWWLYSTNCQRSFRLRPSAKSAERA